MFKSLTQVLQDLKMSISFVFMLKTHILYDLAYLTLALKLEQFYSCLCNFFAQLILGAIQIMC
jgi:hypothetical protein